MRRLSAITSATPVPRGTVVEKCKMERKGLENGMGVIDIARRPTLEGLLEVLSQMNKTTAAGLGGEITYERITHPSALSTAPPSSQKLPVTLFIHGGGYCMSAAREYRMLTWRLSALGKCTVVAPNYRLAPEHCFPAALEDVVQVYAKCVEQVGNANKVAVAGDSAGAGLALSLALYLLMANKPPPRALLLFSPWIDLTLSSPSFELNAQYDWLPASSHDPHFLGPKNEQKRHYYTHLSPPSIDTHPLLSPLFLADPDLLQKLPPTLIQTGTAERLLDEALKFSLSVRLAGNANLACEIYQGKVHAFQCLASYGDVAAQNALESAGHFLRKWFKSTSNNENEQEAGFKFVSGPRFDVQGAREMQVEEIQGQLKLHEEMVKGLK